MHGSLSDHPIFHVLVSHICISNILLLSILSWVHKYLTKGGKSQSLILEKLANIMGPGRDTWNEDPEVKKVSGHSTNHVRHSLTPNPADSRL